MPFYFLNPDFAASPGGRWWRRALGAVLRAVGDDELVAQRFALIEFYGYHSINWAPLPITLPSQHYNFALVQDAIARDAWIAVSRGRRDWEIVVPELANYHRKLVLNTPRSAAISPGNGPDGFELILEALRT